MYLFHILSPYFPGIVIDIIIYSIVIPVIPFQLEYLGYEQVSTKAGWILFTLVSDLRQLFTKAKLNLFW